MASNVRKSVDIVDLRKMFWLPVYGLPRTVNIVTIIQYITCSIYSHCRYGKQSNNCSNTSVCSVKCGHCGSTKNVLASCDPSNGHCSSHCLKGYYGYKCLAACNTTCNRMADQAMSRACFIAVPPIIPLDTSGQTTTIAIATTS
jgi:hypothetical protein